MRHRRRPVRWSAPSVGLVVVGTAVGLTVTGCRPSTTRLSFSPSIGTVYRYLIDVRSASTTTFPGRAPITRANSARFTAIDTVLSADPSGSRLSVQVSQPNTPPHTYIVRLDRQAALVGIDAVGGLPIDVATGMDLRDVLPAAVGAPPGRPLHSGDRWEVDEPVTIPLSAPSRLRGSGQLAEFGVVDHRLVATTTTHATISVAPPSITSTASPGAVGLQGVEAVDASAVRGIRDGAIERASATTVGNFDIVLLPSPATSSVPLVTGHLSIEVRSTTRRVG